MYCMYIIAMFQKNFYYNEEEKEKKENPVQPMICDVCDQNQMASHMCGHCGMKLCFHCHVSHTVCKAPTVQSPQTSDVDAERAELNRQVESQRKVLEMMVDKMTEDEVREVKGQGQLEEEVVDWLKELNAEVMRKIKGQSEEKLEEMRKEKTSIQEKIEVLSQTTDSTLKLSVIKALLLPNDAIDRMRIQCQNQTNFKKLV